MKVNRSKTQSPTDTIEAPNDECTSTTQLNMSFSVTAYPVPKSPSNSTKTQIKVGDFVESSFSNFNRIHGIPCNGGQDETSMSNSDEKKQTQQENTETFEDIDTNLLLCETFTLLWQTFLFSFFPLLLLLTKRSMFGVACVLRSFLLGHVLRFLISMYHGNEKDKKFDEESVATVNSGSRSVQNQSRDVNSEEIIDIDVLSWPFILPNWAKKKILLFTSEMLGHTNLQDSTLRALEDEEETYESSSYLVSFISYYEEKSQLFSHYILGKIIGKDRTYFLANPQSCPPPSFVLLACFTIFCFIVHPEGLTWVLLGKFRDGVCYVLSSSYMWLEMLKDGSVPTIAASGSLAGLITIIGILRQSYYQVSRPRNENSKSIQHKSHHHHKSKRRRGGRRGAHHNSHYKRPSSATSNSSNNRIKNLTTTEPVVPPSSITRSPSPVLDTLLSPSSIPAKSTPLDSTSIQLSRDRSQSQSPSPSTPKVEILELNVQQSTDAVLTDDNPVRKPEISSPLPSSTPDDISVTSSLSTPSSFVPCTAPNFQPVHPSNNKSKQFHSVTNHKNNNYERHQNRKRGTKAPHNKQQHNNLNNNGSNTRFNHHHQTNKNYQSQRQNHDRKENYFNKKGNGRKSKKQNSSYKPQNQANRNLKNHHHSKSNLNNKNSTVSSPDIKLPAQQYHESKSFPSQSQFHNVQTNNDVFQSVCIPQSNVTSMNQLPLIPQTSPSIFNHQRSAFLEQSNLSTQPISSDYHVPSDQSLLWKENNTIHRDTPTSQANSFQGHTSPFYFPQTANSENPNTRQGFLSVPYSSAPSCTNSSGIFNQNLSIPSLKHNEEFNHTTSVVSNHSPVIRPPPGLGFIGRNSRACNNNNMNITQQLSFPPPSQHLDGAAGIIEEEEEGEDSQSIEADLLAQVGGQMAVSILDS